MRFTVVNSSDLRDRLDAGFYVALSEVSERVKHFQTTMSAEDARRHIGQIPEADLKPLQAIVRGEGKTFDMKAINRAIKENPHIALAIMEKNLQPSIDRIQKAIDSHQIQINKLTDLVDILQRENETPAPKF